MLLRSAGQRRFPNPDAAWLTALMDAGLGAGLAVEVSVVLGVIALVGEHSAERATTARAARNSRSKASVSFIFAADAMQATGTPALSTAT